jgi:hypothetical protein
MPGQIRITNYLGFLAHIQGINDAWLSLGKTTDIKLQTDTVHNQVLGHLRPFYLLLV